MFSGTFQVDIAGAISAQVGFAQIVWPEFACADIVLPDCQALDVGQFNFMPVEWPVSRLKSRIYGRPLLSLTDTKMHTPLKTEHLSCKPR